MQSGVCWGCSRAAAIITVHPRLGVIQTGFQRAPHQMKGGREQLDEERLKEFSINNFSK